MMRNIGIALMIASGLWLLDAAAADRLAVADPAGKGGISRESVDQLGAMLEASVQGEFEIVTRAALNQMMTEIGLGSSSGLVDMQPEQTAKIGRLKGVKYLLVSSVGQLGNRCNLSLAVIDGSTGTLLPGRKITRMFNNLDVLADQLPDMLRIIALSPPISASGRGAFLMPVVTAPGAPAYLADSFTALFTKILLDNNIRLYALNSIQTTLRENNLHAVERSSPADYMRIAELLRADFLIVPTIDRFDMSASSTYDPFTRRDVVNRVANIEGFLKVIVARDGELVASIPFRANIDFLRDPAARGMDTSSWNAEDFGRYMIERLLYQLGPDTVVQIQKLFGVAKP